MKVALCFIISYQHILNKEEIWKEWIEYNKDIINVYFHYKNINLIKSPWIRKNCLPLKYTSKTTYYHVVPGYISILNYAFNHDIQNKWFCLLTESCVPIISPQHFRKLFFNHYSVSLFKWKNAYWNIDIHCRANLKYLNKEYHLANDPWFTLSRDHVHKSILFVVKKNDIYQKVCKGGLANESLFAIILQTFNELKNINNIKLINVSSTISDWSRMSNATSPHSFDGTDEDIEFILKELQINKYAIFLRKVSPNFPNNLLKDIIYNTNNNHVYDNNFISFIRRKKGCFYYFKYIICVAFLLFNISIFVRNQYKSQMLSLVHPPI